ncbi:MAG: hypothetical protein R3338_00800 [Thermoanaerobaculia bacterium]|nr:hypothetical protein [Thermoanaerobaculia bacterium]
MRHVAALSGRSILMVVMALAATITVMGQEGGADSYEVIVDQFFENLEEGEYAKSIEGLYSTNPWLQANSDQFTQLKNQFVSLGSLIGDYIGHERLVTQPLGERFVYVWELAYFDREPLQLHFTFYKAKNSWQLWTISYDEQADVTAQEIAKRKLASFQ